jgi:hypothetical protein
LAEVKSAIRILLRQLGLRITRVGQLNRFDAMAHVLLNLRNIGHQPTVIVDGGANIGEWAKLARAINPGKTIHFLDRCRIASRGSLS